MDLSGIAIATTLAAGALLVAGLALVLAFRARREARRASGAVAAAGAARDLEAAERRASDAAMAWQAFFHARRDERTIRAGRGGT